jgi:hypothetical protein
VAERNKGGKAERQPGGAEREEGKPGVRAIRREKGLDIGDSGAWFEFPFPFLPFPLPPLFLGPPALGALEGS